MVGITLLLFSYSTYLYHQYNQDINIKDSKQSFTYEINTQPKEIEHLPLDFTQQIEKANIDITNINISEILNRGYTVIPNSSIEGKENIPLLLTTENITQYYYSNLADIEKQVEKKIERELLSSINDIKVKVLLTSPYLSNSDRAVISETQSTQEFSRILENKELLYRLINISEQKERLLNLVQLKDSLYLEPLQFKSIEIVGENIYLEQNPTLYQNLLEKLLARKDSLKKSNLYDEEYEYLIEDIQKILEEDSSVYSKMINSMNPHTSIYAITKEYTAFSTISTLKDPYTIDINNFNKEYDITPTQQRDGTVRIPVIMYHQITNPPLNSSSFVRNLYTTVEDFEKQIAYLTKKNYKTVSSQEFFEILQSGKNPPQKTVMLTFDDSTISHYTNAYPILKKYNQTGTFFVTSHRSQISSAQLKEMSDNGMDIQSHTQTHPDLTKVYDLNTLYREVAGSKSELEARAGRGVIALAYPGCVGDSKTISSLTSSGYELGFSCGKTVDHRYSSRFSIARIHAPYSLEDLKNILSGIYPF